MIPYNTDLKKLAVPEYGRLIHQLVDYCVDIQDREERNLFAAAIVETMKSMTQEKGKTIDDRKYWDHLYLISDFKLDIDSPFGKPEEGMSQPKPEKMPYTATDFKRRHYGAILQRIIKQVSVMPNSEEKDGYVELIATHIKRMLSSSETETASDEMVFQDLAVMSDSNINVEPGVFTLPEFKEEKPVNNKQKRKKNRQ